MKANAKPAKRDHAKPLHQPPWPLPCSLRGKTGVGAGVVGSDTASSSIKYPPMSECCGGMRCGFLSAGLVILVSWNWTKDLWSCSSCESSSSTLVKPNGTMASNTDRHPIRARSGSLGGSTGSPKWRPKTPTTKAPPKLVTLAGTGWGMVVSNLVSTPKILVLGNYRPIISTHMPSFFNP